MKTIKKMLMNPCNITRKVPFEVINYEEVIDLWKIYKNGSNFYINENMELKNIFEFHKSNINHIVLFSSVNHDNCILLCKVDEKYFNLLIPMSLRKDYSFVATYT